MDAAPQVEGQPLSDDDRKLLAQLVEGLKDREWRLRNLYWIVNKDGNKVRFSPNRTQRRLLDRLGKRNLVLKSRQHGITTLMCLLALDTCLFRSNTKAGIIAHKKEDAESFFRDKILYAYDNLPDYIKGIRKITRRDMNGELVFENGSHVAVSLSHRGGTLQFLHVTEYGPMCGQFPQRAREVKTGALNTVAPDGIVTIESTAYGVEGDFYTKTQRAMQLHSQAESGSAKLTEMDYLFHFFAWYEDDTNEVDPDGVGISPDLAAYFDKLETEHQVNLTPRKRAWYASKSEEQGDDMKREHPSTPQEAFEQSVEGAYYGKELAKVDSSGRIQDLPILPGYPVNTFWDIGKNDTTAIWFHQQVGMWHHFIDFYENAGEGADHYVRILRERGYLYGKHYLPHDGENSEWMMSGMQTRRELLEKMLDQPCVKVNRIERIQDGIDMVKACLPLVRFDRTRCGEFTPGCGRGGLPALRNYRREWNEKTSTWHDHPLHNWASDGADAFRQWAQGYPMTGINDEETKAAMRGRRKPRRGGGMSA